MNGKRRLLLLVALMLVGVVLASSCVPSASTAGSGLDDLDEWDMVVVGDHLTGGVVASADGQSAAELYAALIESELGVTVKVEERTPSFVTARRALGALRNQEDDASLELRGWPDLVREAEVVVFSASPEHPTLGEGSWVWQCENVDCSSESLDGFATALDAIFKEILQLRDGSPTIIRTVEYYARNPAVWKERGIEDHCTQCYEQMNAVIRQAAKENGVLVAPLADAFNGPNHDKDPVEAGLVVGGWRLTEAGAQLMAEQLRELGYDPVTQ
jgi:hypothetical protein